MTQELNFTYVQAYSVRETRSWGGLGTPLKRGVPPQTGDCRPQEGSFHFASRFTEERTKIAKKWQWCLWRFMCPLSMHQFIEISICALENKIIQTFDVKRPVKVCAPTGLSRAPPPKLSGELSSQAPYQYGKPAHEGDPPQKGDRPPHEGDRGPTQEGTFHFASRFTGERTKTAKSDNDVYL